MDIVIDIFHIVIVSTASIASNIIVCIAFISFNNNHIWLLQLALMISKFNNRFLVDEVVLAW